MQGKELYFADFCNIISYPHIHAHPGPLYSIPVRLDNRMANPCKPIETISSVYPPYYWGGTYTPMSHFQRNPSEPKFEIAKLVNNTSNFTRLSGRYIVDNGRYIMTYQASYGFFEPTISHHLERKTTFQSVKIKTAEAHSCRVSESSAAHSASKALKPGARRQVLRVWP